MYTWDTTKDWEAFTDIEKLSWTVKCNADKEAEVKKYCKKMGIDFECCKAQLEVVNPMQRWYEYRAKEARKQKKAKKV
jgi:uncharacterized protein YndB with AHSA1/START domain